MLYIISTPIGNLKDISQRAIETLNSVGVIAAESPNDSVKLLNAYGIKSRGIFKYNDKNMRSVSAKAEEILKNNDVAYITSAGTPGISDPGQELVKMARNLGVEVRVIPGPSALVSAIAVSGIRAKQFAFVSFPPKKSGQLKHLLEKYRDEKEILVFFESTYRITKTIEMIKEVSDVCRVFVAKEMTKIFESYFNGRPSEVLEEFKKDSRKTRGEFVVIVDFSGK